MQPVPAQDVSGMMLQHYVARIAYGKPEGGIAWKTKGGMIFIIMDPMSLT